MSALRAAETIETHGCSITSCRVDGPEARELFLRCQPIDDAADAARQADAAYRAIQSVLENEGGRFASVVSETIFLQNPAIHLDPVRAARRRAIASFGAATHRPACTEIGQPPLAEKTCLEVALQAVVPHATPLRIETFEARSDCGCAECVRAHALRFHVADEARFHAGGLCGSGRGAYEQALAMFGVAEELLQRAGMTFRDVVRTWIHLRDIDRDYADLNRARRAFFEARAIDPAPASTGIGGGPVPDRHALCLGLHAIRAEPPPARIVMTSPTLNDAPQYGADFVRGMRVEEANKIALHVSGTASIDEAGRTAHPGGFDAQADRMLTNVAALLAGQGAGFRDIVSAVTYLKHPTDAPRLREKLRAAGYVGFPNVCVEASVCRPDLLCETEALAILPRTGGTPSPPG